ncbi:MAG: hypothetical protein ACREMA_18410, partial [Longimicrobiales bacterium]
MTGSDLPGKGLADEERHRARMQRKKTVIDGRIAAAQECRGVLL